MKRILLFTIIGIFANGLLQAQSLEELKTQKADLEAKQAEAQGVADGYAGEVAGLEDAIKKLSGWVTGLGGNIGFDFNKSNNWAANPNPDASASSLNIGLTGFANQDKDKSLWYNKAIISKSWQDVDLSKEDGMVEEDGLFDNGTVDILNLSSLYGYKLSKSIAISALGEANTSLGNFFKPGAVDIGAGVTYTGVPNLVVVVHPLNYHIAFPADGGTLETSSTLGLKLRADYTKSFSVSGKKIAWSSTLTSYLPYSETKTLVTDPFTEMDFEAGVTEYTWLNTLSFEIWKGIGVGLSAGIRNADFEDFSENQNFYSLGLTYIL